MKKLLFLTLAALLGFSSMSNAQDQKWFIDAGVDLTVTATNGETASTIAFGAGLHRMIGEKFSMGVNLAYARALSVNALEVDLAFAYYGRINDSFYYVPQLAAGPAFFFEGGASVTGFGAAFSPFGLEFRPTPRLGFRTSIIDLTYVNLNGSSIWNFKISPGLSVIYRF